MAARAPWQVGHSHSGLCFLCVWDTDFHGDFCTSSPRLQPPGLTVPTMIEYLALPTLIQGTHFRGGEVPRPEKPYRRPVPLVLQITPHRTPMRVLHFTPPIFPSGINVGFPNFQSAVHLRGWSPRFAQEPAQILHSHAQSSPIPGARYQRHDAIPRRHPEHAPADGHPGPCAHAILPDTQAPSS